MMNRQIVQIPAEQVQKLHELEEIRLDLKGYPLSRKVHVLLQEKLADLFLGKKIPDKHRYLKGKWYEQVRECFPIHVITLVAIGVVTYTEEMLGKPFTKILISSQGNKAWWCNYIDDIFEVGYYLLDKLRNEQIRKEYYKRTDMIYLEVRELCERLRKTNLKRLSKTDFKEAYNHLYDSLQRYHALSWDIDAFDIVIEEKLKEGFKELFIQKRGKFSANEYNADYNIIGTSSELSFVSLEHIDLNSAAQEVRESKRIKKLFTRDSRVIEKRLRNSYPKFYNKIKALEEKYWWTSLGWVNRDEKNSITFIDDIKKILKETRDIEGDSKNTRDFVEEISLKKKELSKIYAFNDDITYLVHLMDRFVVYHDYRKEIQMKGTAVMNYFLFELSRRSGVKYDDLVWAFPFEIQEFMRTNHLDLAKIEKRKEAYFVLITKDGIEELTGERAIQRRNEELKADLSEINDFKGVIASVGKVCGRAKVCYSAEDAIQKMKKGDILVASMTLPNYVNAMKKAAAIVTDEGGVTCHAAIVSRELKIPSIVGTQIATKVINDGDLIEVNANHGAVRIIERKV